MYSSLRFQSTNRRESPEPWRCFRTRSPYMAVNGSELFRPKLRHRRLRRATCAWRRRRLKARRRGACELNCNLAMARKIARMRPHAHRRPPDQKFIKYCFLVCLILPITRLSSSVANMLGKRCLDLRSRFANMLGKGRPDCYL